MENRKYLAEDLLNIPLHVKLQKGFQKDQLAGDPVKVFTCYEAALKHLSGGPEEEFDTMVFLYGPAVQNEEEVLSDLEIMIQPVAVAKVVKLENITDLQDVLVEAKDWDLG